MMRRPAFLAVLSAALALPLATPAHAFPHVMRPGESLAKIAERVYGRIEFERVIVAANGLDVGGGMAAVPGQRLEVPALEHVRVQSGDTWATLATAWLGHAERQDVLSAANDSSPWMTPSEGAEIVVPYNLRVIAGPTDSIVSIAQRFTGNRERAWVLDRYNFLKGKAVKRGDVVLVPLTDLRLTEAGRAEAAVAFAAERSQGAGGTRDAQRRAEAEIPSLLGEVRSGRFVDAVLRGTRVLGYGELSRPQQATLHRQLLEAYVALDARGHASSACRAWREADAEVALDPVYLSPKILTACNAAGGATGAASGSAAPAASAARPSPRRPRWPR
ncbi:MAG: LysM domain-containing protein, partial [Myxococcales bacterium]